MSRRRPASSASSVSSASSTFICVAFFSVTARDIFTKLGTHVQGGTPLFPFERFSDRTIGGATRWRFVKFDYEFCVTSFSVTVCPIFLKVSRYVQNMLPLFPFEGIFDWLDSVATWGHQRSYPSITRGVILCRIFLSNR